MSVDVLLANRRSDAAPAGTRFPFHERGAVTGCVREQPRQVAIRGFGRWPTGTDATALRFTVESAGTSPVPVIAGNASERLVGSWLRGYACPVGATS